MTRKRILIAALLGIPAASLAVAALASLPASRIYCVETEFSAAPDDYTAFKHWLRKQPGVVEHTVHVDRISTTPPKLVLTFEMVQNCWLKPSFPDVEAKANDLGYSIDSGGFRDQDELN